MGYFFFSPILSMLFRGVKTLASGILLVLTIILIPDLKF